MSVDDDSLVKVDEGTDKSSSPAKCDENKLMRIYRKSSQDGNLILFLPQRHLNIKDDVVDPIVGVVLIHQSVVAKNLKVFGQVILLFRYGREDEEMMGIRFCNEILMASEQVYPPAKSDASNKSPEKDLKICKNGFVSVPICLQVTGKAPPSIRLHPCRPYSGSSIGTNYEVQVFASESAEVPPKQRKMICMKVFLHETFKEDNNSSALFTAENQEPPRLSLEKNFLLSDASVQLDVSLSKVSYSQTDKIHVSVRLSRRNSGHSVRKIKLSIIQQVDVAMFSNGSFKNCLGLHIDEELNPAEKTFSQTYELDFHLQKDYSWLALEEKILYKSDPNRKIFAPSVVLSKSCIFAIKVHYYVQVTLIFGLWKRDIVLKLPFVLKSINPELEEFVENHA